MLTQEQLLFLRSHGLSEEDTFDVHGMAQSKYYPIMKTENKIIAYNTKPCKNGHTMRTRSGHCPQCNTAYLRFNQRNSEGGFVYVAVCEERNITKVGYTSDIISRAESLNRTYYAGFCSWRILFAIECSQAGKIEGLVKSALRSYRCSKIYDHDSKDQEATELLKCYYTKVKKIVLEVCECNNFDYTIIVNKKNIAKF